MTSISGDPALRAALERQLALLLPVVDHLVSVASSGPSPLLADDWRGPAAEAAADFLDEFRLELRATAEAVSDEASRIRLALAGMP